jgi:hypothetical protein
MALLEAGKSYRAVWPASRVVAGLTGVVEPAVG